MSVRTDERHVIQNSSKNFSASPEAKGLIAEKFSELTDRLAKICIGKLEMNIVVLDALHFLGRETARKSIVLLLSSFLLGGVYYVYLDFLKTYVRRPSHFVRRSLPSRFKSAKFDAPLVELRPGETYREVLARGSALVSLDPSPRENTVDIIIKVSRPSLQDHALPR